MLILAGVLSTNAQTFSVIRGEKITGELRRYENFPSTNVAPRNVDVWLPPDFSPRRRYAVVYIHDGQMLFDSTSTWNKQEWKIDETMTELLGKSEIRDAIIVGIWNTAKRWEEYMPEKPFAAKARKENLIASGFDLTKLLADEYLRFIVTELKPFIDKNYQVKTGRGNTFVVGSSMGGLISLYAISEYPEIFGGAACLSTHFPAGDGIVVEYMKTSLPSPRNHRIYFDYGTETLDATYEPFQLKADEVMKAKGYKLDRNWVTKKFPGDDHSETAWSRRAAIPLRFLLGK